MMSQRELIQQEIFDEVNENQSENKTIELSPQEEVDMNDIVSKKYDYNSSERR